MKVRQVMARPREGEVARGKHVVKDRVMEEVGVTMVAVEVGAEAIWCHAGFGTLMDGTKI